MRGEETGNEDGRWKKMKAVLPGDSRAVVIVASGD